LIHLIWLKVNYATTDPVAQRTAQPALYDIENVSGVSCIVTNTMGGPPPPPGTVVPAIVSIKYLSNAAALSDATAGTPTFVVALQCFVMSGIYRGLHEDAAEADKMWMAGEQYLQRARTRYDQQKPKRSFFNSRIAAVRLIRRPWPRLGIGGWGPPGPPG
jgi:hypothetical protein